MKDCARCGASFTDRSPAQARRFCSDNCRKRKHETERRANCPRCDKPMGAGSDYASHTPELCGECRRAEQRASSNAHEFERLWNEGYTIPQLMAHFSVSKGTVTSLMHRYRQQGLTIPYRRDGEWLANLRAASDKRWAA